MSKLTTELIEKLEDQKKHLRPYGDDTASSMMRLNTEEINAIIAALDSSEHNAKCVQFAEDVKRLKKSGSVRFMASRVGGILCQCILYRTTTTDGDERETVKGRGDDIYTAARKAVEALAKGEA